MHLIKTAFNSVSHLLFPQLCNGCGSDLVNGHHLICLKCYQHLHETGFASLANNPVEKVQPVKESNINLKDFEGRFYSEELNTDYTTKRLSAQDLQAIVAAWQADAISRETMMDLLRRGEVLPEKRSAEKETGLIAGESQQFTQPNRSTF